MGPFAKVAGACLLFMSAFSAYGQSGISADLAKKCREEAVKAYPTPKAGTKAQGVEKSQRDAFQACVSKGAENNKNQRQ
jgi:hypothetical protein